MPFNITKTHITTMIPCDNTDCCSKGGSSFTVAPDDLEMFSKKNDFTKILTNHLKKQKNVPFLQKAARMKHVGFSLLHEFYSF